MRFDWLWAQSDKIFHLLLWHLQHFGPLANYHRAMARRAERGVKHLAQRAALRW